MRRHKDARTAVLAALMHFLDPFIARSNLAGMIKRQQDKCAKELDEAQSALLVAIRGALPPGAPIVPSSPAPGSAVLGEVQS